MQDDDRPFAPSIFKLRQRSPVVHACPLVLYALALHTIGWVGQVRTTADNHVFNTWENVNRVNRVNPRSNRWGIGKGESGR